MTDAGHRGRGALRFTTLRARALALLVTAVALVALFAFVIFRPLFARTFELELEKRGQVVASILEQHYELRLALAVKDKADASRVAQEILAGDTDVRYVLLLDANDQVLGEAEKPDRDQVAVTERVARHKHDWRAAGEGGGARTVRQVDAASGLQRFTREVRPTRTSQSPDELGFAAGDKASSRLGTILLGLSSSASRERMTVQIFGVIALTGLVMVLAFLVFFSWMARRLDRIVGFASSVAAGDLFFTLEDDNQDEIGRLAASLRDMADRTGTMVARLQDAAGALGRVSTEILASSSQQGEASSKQAASVAETGATVAELRETFHQASERAQGVIDLAKKSEESTNTGRRAVEESIVAMEDIRDQVFAISRTMLSLVERTKLIGNIIETVNDLAEQSNVLALNAAIEAAKAGEQGRGFAVVAREVRSLAERSKDSTAQVRAILQDIEKASREALGVIDEGTRKTHSGMDLSNRAGESIAHLDHAINESSTAARQIAASTRQQAVGVEQIWQAMKEIDRAVNESASGIRQLEEASQNMKTLSEEMAQLVAQYQVSRPG